MFKSREDPGDEVALDALEELRNNYYSQCVEAPWTCNKARVNKTEQEKKFVITHRDFFPESKDLETKVNKNH